MSSDHAGLVLVVRHPETVANAEKRYVGSTESPYTALGESQAAELGSALAAWHPDRVYSSPRRRALDVARLAVRQGVPLKVLDEIAEVDFGCAENMTATQMSAAGLCLDYPGLPELAGTRVCGESWEVFERRVRSAGHRFAGHDGKTAVVTHGGVVRVLMMSWFGLDARDAFRLAVGNGAGALVGFDAGVPSLLAFGPIGLVCAE